MHKIYSSRYSIIFLKLQGQQLIGAARDGNNAEAQRLLKSGANANFRGVVRNKNTI